ncbi:MAG: hypothetical protein KGM96_08965 [Acidobacteriota bacterium]|nr:hypothetical protein [Acidobacteriota bacterium]
MVEKVLSHPIFAVLLTVALALLSVVGVQVIVQVSCVLAWTISFAWIARAKWISSQTIGTRLLTQLLIAGLLGSLFWGFGSWALRQHAKEQVQVATPSKQKKTSLQGTGTGLNPEAVTTSGKANSDKQPLQLGQPVLSHAKSSKPRVSSAEVQFVGMSVDPGGSSAPLSFKPLLNYRVVGGTVYHLKMLSVGFAATTGIDFPGIGGKFYRAFDKMFSPDKVPEVPELAGNEGFSRSPQLSTAFSGSVPGVFAILYTHATWADRLGVKGELTQCFETRVEKGPIDSQAKWGLCQVSDPTAYDLKYEAMNSAQLQLALSNLETALRQQDDQHDQEEEARFQNQRIHNKEEWKAEAGAEVEAFRSEGRHYANEICPTLEPLVEEVMFRFSYLPYFDIQRHTTELQAKNHQQVDPKMIAMETEMEQNLIRRLTIGCTAGGSYHPQLRDVVNALDMLNAAMTEVTKDGMGFPVPFDSRPQ